MSIFSEDFLWGVSTSGFQFEMGDPAGRNIDQNTDWYAWVHDPVNIKKGIVSGDLPENGIDNWSLYKTDHMIAKRLGLSAYRIGIEWSRIFPKSTSLIEFGVEKASDGNIIDIKIDDHILEDLDEEASKDALSHYREVIQDLRDKNFKVFLCLNHFTLPLWIHNPITVRDTKLHQGPKGWIDQETIIEFTKYAAYMAWKLGDIIDKWATFNEPMVIPETGYLIPQSGFPPGLNNFKASKKAAQNLALAHSLAYDAIKRLDTIKADEDSEEKAEVGIIHNMIPASPLEMDRESDIKAAEFMNHLHNHFFLQSACNGWLDENFSGSKDKGEVKNYLGKRLDWLGVNYYTRTVVKGKKSLLARVFAGIPAIPEMVENYGYICQPNSISAEKNPTSDLGWEIHPEGLLDSLKSITKYGKPIYITENGVADAKDTLRSKFITDHLRVLERAINEEKIDVKGYFHWALTDNYEWAQGFGMKFGLYSVDHETKSRNERRSAKNLQKTIKRSQEGL